MRYLVKSDKKYIVEINRESNQSNQFEIEVDGKIHHVEIKETYANGSIKTLIVDKQVIPVEILKQADGFPKTVILNGLPFDVETEKIKAVAIGQQQEKREISGEIKAGLPGQILTLLVKKGDSVSEGEPIIILESMKMENEILSPKDGTVSQIAVSVGQVVKKGELIIKID